MSPQEITNLWNRIIALEEAVKKIPPQRIDNHGADINSLRLLVDIQLTHINSLKAQIANLLLLTTTQEKITADHEKRIKMLENSNLPTKTVLNNNWYRWFGN